MGVGIFLISEKSKRWSYHLIIRWFCTASWDECTTSCQFLPVWTGPINIDQRPMNVRASGFPVYVQLRNGKAMPTPMMFVSSVILLDHLETSLQQAKIVMQEQYSICISIPVRYSLSSCVFYSLVGESRYPRPCRARQALRFMINPLALGLDVGCRRVCCGSCTQRHLVEFMILQNFVLISLTFILWIKQRHIWTKGHCIYSKCE